MILGYQGGASHTYKINGTDVTIKTLSALITAIQTYSESNILSTPQILATDNEDSEIKIEDKIPVVGAATAATATAGATQNITNEKIGITLKITPQISGERVRMKIEQTVNDLSAEKPPSGLATTNVAITERSTKTVVVVPNKDTVAIGGLIREQLLDAESKFPFLGDIPLIGWLFKGSETKRRKTNLLLFITPHVIDSRGAATEISDRKMQQRGSFLKKNLGGKDYFEEEINEMKRQLDEQRLRPDDKIVDKDWNARPIHGTIRSNDSSEGLTAPQPAQQQPLFPQQNNFPVAPTPPVNNFPSGIPASPGPDSNVISAPPPPPSSVPPLEPTPRQ
jgi:general secretion pathway protein D